MAKLSKECTDAIGRCGELSKKVRVGRPGHDNSLSGRLSGSSPYLTEKGAKKFATKLIEGGSVNVGVKKKGNVWYVSSGRKPKALMPRKPKRKVVESRKPRRRKALFPPRRRR